MSTITIIFLLWIYFLASCVSDLVWTRAHIMSKAGYKAGEKKHLVIGMVLSLVIEVNIGLYIISSTSIGFITIVMATRLLVLFLKPHRIYGDISVKILEEHIRYNQKNNIKEQCSF